MVFVTQFSRRQGFETRVVFDVGRSQHNGSRLRKFEQHSFEGSETRLVQMLDALYHSRGVVIGESAVSVHQRALKELQSFSLASRPSIQSQSFLGDLKGAVRKVNANDLIDAAIF